MILQQPTIPTIIVDTREQHGYEWDEARDGVRVKRAKLNAGDYSVEGCELSGIAIERKSVDDWVNTITHSSERFAREIDRMLNYHRAYIVVECGLHDILYGKYARSVTNPPDRVLSRTLGFMHTYAHVLTVIFAGDRIAAREVVKRLLVGYARGVRCVERKEGE